MRQSRPPWPQRSGSSPNPEPGTDIDANRHPRASADRDTLARNFANFYAYPRNDAYAHADSDPRTGTHHYALTHAYSYLHPSPDADTSAHVDARSYVDPGSDLYASSQTYPGTADSRTDVNPGPATPAYLDANSGYRIASRTHETD